MKRVFVKRSCLEGGLRIPSSKSHSLRAILFAGLCDGESVIEGYLESPDTFSMLNAMECLGAELIFKSADKMIIKGVSGEITKASNVIDAGNSGIVLRFVSALSGLGKYPIVITGDHSIRYQRPMLPLIEGLNQLGVRVCSTKGDGYAPLIIEGPITNSEVSVSGRDSQPVSALLIALQFAPHPVTIKVIDLGELPWIKLTLDWLDRLGLSYVKHSDVEYTIPGKARLSSFEYCVPGDLSSLSFPIVAALITGSSLFIENVDFSDCQGDKKLIEVFIKMGARIEVNASKKTLQVYSSPDLKGVKVDLNESIDGVVILAVLACYAEGETLITGVEVAREKECDRIKCITKELKKMGAEISALKDGLFIRGGPLKGADVYSHKDHRMALSLIIAHLAAEGDGVVEDTECIKKTYPNFIKDFCRVGALLEER